MSYTVTFTMAVPLIPRGSFLQWTLNGSPPSGAYRFVLQRSGSLAGPWKDIADVVDTYSYTDRLVTPHEEFAPNMLSVTREFYYQVLARGPDGVVVSATTETTQTLAPKQRQLLRKLLHDEYVVLKKYNGLPVAVLKRRHWGTRCPKCFDRPTKENVRGSCITCWGTGIVGGYWDPVLTYARRTPVQWLSQIAPEGKVDLATSRAILLNLPHLEHDDILVALSDNRRFWVDQQSETSIRTVPVHQTVQMAELPHSHIIYRFPVDPRSVPAIL